VFTRVLYPNDFYDILKEVLDYIKKLKEARTREGVIVHIIDEKVDCKISCKYYRENNRWEKG